MKKTISFILMSLVLLLIGFSCYDPDDDIIENRYCDFYRPDYATIEIKLEYKYFDNTSPVQTALIQLFNWSPDGKLTVNDLDGGKLMINGHETEFKDSFDVEGFYPKDKSFVLLPGTDYTVTFEHDSALYEFETSIPQKFDDFGIPDVVNTSSDFHLQLNSLNNSFYQTTIYLVAHDPKNPTDSLLLVKNEVYDGDEITIPFEILAPALNGWEAELYVRRIEGGSYDLRFLDDSKITGTCSFYKKFELNYSNGN